MTIHVYWNLNKKCWSVRHKGLIIKHLKTMTMQDCSFHVQPAGRERVVKTKVKQVHAYVKGNITGEDVTTTSIGKRISYNPYKRDHFVFASTNERVDTTNALYFNESGQVYEII